MHIENFKIFSDLVESQSFSRAAKLNGVTQSAVSQQIRGLEEKYDRRLIERGKRNLAPTQAGKGRNAWYCMGYALALEHCEAIALHDCDIVTYDRTLPARLLYPVANPTFSFEFCKGYYSRVHKDRLSGRLTRLFYTPLIRALKQVIGPLDYLDFMDSFRYPLAGEFSLRKDFIKTVRIPGDWGLEVGVMSEVYRNLSRHQICQADIADQYDHKHQPLSLEEAQGGLVKMSVEIAKSLYRKLATEGVTLSNEFFRTIKATYFRIALDMMAQYHRDAAELLAALGLGTDLDTRVDGFPLHVPAADHDLA